MSTSRQFRKYTVRILLVITMALSLSACGNPKTAAAPSTSEAENQISKTYPIREISAFGNLVLDCSQEQMRADGFDVGDLITLEYEDISLTLPITTDYVYDVTNTGALVWYGERRPSFGINSGNFAVDYGFVSDTVTTDTFAGKTCSVTMAEKGARKEYLVNIELHMTNNRQDYDSDMEYANIYPVAGGTLQEGRIYRGSSLFNTETNRTEAAQKVVEELQIRNVIDLTMSPEEAGQKAQQGAWETSPYVADLLNGDHIQFFSTGINYKAGFDRDMADAFRTLMHLEPPVYLNCQMGRDRTGMASILLMATAGASYEEIRDNFMQTYYNYYKIKPGDAAYEAMEDGIFTIMMKILTKVENPSTLTPEELTSAAAAYLKNGGFTDDEFAALQAYLNA